MDKINCFEYCNYKEHVNNNYIYTHYCHTCELRLCPQCLILHNNDSKNSNHSCEEITTDSQKAKILIKEVKKSKNIKSFYDKSQEEKVKAANTLLNNFKDLMLITNNKFSKMLLDYKEKYNELEDFKKSTEQKLEDDDFNLESALKNLEEKADEVYVKMKLVDELYNFTMNYIINREKNVRNYTLEIEQRNSIDKSIDCKQEIKKQNKFNEIQENKNNNNININTQNNQKLLNERKNNNRELKESKIIPKYAHINTQEKDQTEQNNIMITSKINLNKDKSDNKDSLYINRKKGRDYDINEENNDLKESKFTFGENDNKKRKLDEININSIEEIKSGNNSGIIFQQINNYNTKVNNIYIGNNNNSSNKNEIQDKSNEKKILFNLKLNLEGEVSVSLNVNIGKVYMFKTFHSNEIKYENPLNDKFPYFGSRLINIDNKSFVMGGKSKIEENSQGNKLVFKLEYVNDIKMSTSDEINCYHLPDMLFPHVFHHLIYSKIYNIIFVISGKYQNKCEYGILDENKESIIEWREMDSVRNPRENDICFLINERYIFLLGEKIDVNYNYEVYDISNIYKNGKWKAYNFKPNGANKGIFMGVNIPGIIEVKDNVYVLGGYLYGIGNNLNWKIYFSSDERDKDDNEYKRIEAIIELKSDRIKNCGKALSFLGQQKFMEYNDSFININILGKYIKFNQRQLDESL